MTREFRGDESRSAGMVRQKLQRFFAVLLSAVVEGAAHHNFLALRVDALVEKEFRIFARLVNGPACERLGHRDYVLLRIAGIDAYGV